MPGKDFTRVGVQHQRGPKCSFDGDELRFPISRGIWEDPRRLLTARRDLATFAAIADARLFELGSGEQDSDYLFWQKEARRIPRLYKRLLPAPRRTNFSATATAGEFSTRTPGTQEGGTRERPIESPATPHNSAATFTFDDPRTDPNDGFGNSEASTVLDPRIYPNSRVLPDPVVDDGETLRRAAAERASDRLCAAIVHAAALEEEPRGRKRYRDDEVPYLRLQQRRPLVSFFPRALRLQGTDDGPSMLETEEPSGSDEVILETQHPAENEVADPQRHPRVNAVVSAGQETIGGGGRGW
ncbi:hypothetical protein BDW75DRAFT_53611 [Aspergillus navahoensis]